ncbi:MAG: isoprenylcysteine carboxylmethyltransferase family protein [Acidobacteriota bacterium]
MRAHIIQWVALVWGVSELALGLWKRSGASARKRDRGSLHVLWITIVIAITAGFWLRHVRGGAIAMADLPLLILALALVAAGVLLRAAAIATLRHSFTVDVAVSDDQQLIRHGPYRYVRHPSYTGMLLIFLGLGLGMGNWYSVAAVMVPVLLALAYRIRIEEQAMREAFGTVYDDYARTTRGVIPGVW